MNMGAKTWQKYHYNQKAVTTEIKAESSATVVVNINGKDCYYKVTYGETRLVPHDANMEKGVDTSGVLTADYGNFKVLCIGAKDCVAPGPSTIQGVVQQSVFTLT